MALSGLTGLEPTNINVTGIATFEQTVGIAGTLTYEDVTNIDSVGVVTARTGIKVLAGGINAVGVVTATSFVGSGSGLTGLPAGVTINNNADNRIITGSGTANTLEGESNLTYDGTTLLVNKASGTGVGYLVVQGGTSSGDYGIVQVKSGSTVRGRLVSDASVDAFRLDSAGRASAPITFHTGSSYTERLRIESGGRVLIGETSVTGSTQKLVIGNGGNENFEFSPAMTSNNLNGGLIEYLHRNDGNTRPDLNLYTGGAGAIKFYTNGTERIRITSTGLVKIQGDGGNTGFFLSNAYSQASMLGGMYYNGSSWVRDALGTRAPAGVFLFTGGHVAFLTAPETSGTTATPTEKVRISNDGRLLLNTTAVVNTDDFLTIKRPAGNHAVTSLTLDATTTTGTYANALIYTKSKDYYYNGLIFNSSTGHQGGIGGRMTTNGGSTPQIEIRIGGSSFNQSDIAAMKFLSTGTSQANHLTSRNGIVQIQQVTSETRYSGSSSSVDLIVGGTFTPRTSAPRFLIMIFCPVNTSDDSDAGGGNANFYKYGRLEYRKNGGSWLECNNQGNTAQQGGYAAHIELSPNRTGGNSTDYWAGDRYRMEHKQATILVTNVGDCGSNGNVQFKLRCYQYTGNFIQIGQPHGYGTDDNYGVQPWGFTVFELAPDSSSYTAY